MDSVSLIILLVIAVVLGIQLRPFLGAWRMRGSEAPDPGGPAGAPSPRLVYFWSPSCSMCKGMSRVIDELREEHPEIRSVDVTREPEIAREYGVMATPTLVVIREGKVEKVLLGARGRRQIEALLEAS